jgi:hypothetical protein
MGDTNTHTFFTSWERSPAVFNVLWNTPTMATSASSSDMKGSLVDLPSHPVGYIAVLAALATGIIHLLAGPRVMEFSQMMGVLFILNGLGFLGGIALYATRYWRRELYLVAALYALATILALFVFQGFSVEAFYSRGSLNPMAVASKVAELVVLVCGLYLYQTS